MATPIPPYGVAIQQAIADGNLSSMRDVAATAERHVAEVSAALQQLRQEIARLESSNS